MGLWQNGSLCKYSLSLVLAMTSMVKPGEILVILLTWCVSYQTHTLFAFYSKLTWISSTVITKRGTKWPELLSDWKVVLIIMRCCSSGWRRHSVWQCDSVTPPPAAGVPPSPPPPPDICSSYLTVTIALVLLVWAPGDSFVFFTKFPWYLLTELSFYD